ncbi:DUF3006 domain-containing protein [Deinococcus taeanensis]|uniref:DUF3006 domain-containing protein n=1 Tax=Deinococcus taeanensis TaxID=2737050 RepID=UPI001CDBF30A|nr:DUF3006 domain-containing protein [Deinococcus taeanensis]UBV42742.1 DUF3006 domain-containing protein [Deinococcus taeanensis]
MSEEQLRAGTEPRPAAEHWTVDALEDTPHGPVARLERPDGRTLTRPLRDLPAGTREGDLLAVDDGPDGLTLRSLPRESAERRAQAQAQLDALNAHGRERLLTQPEGEIDL